MKHYNSCRKLAIRNARRIAQERGLKERGFTLIELSIVLVIIGLIVGGVLVGQDLIRAAEVRATISQIEKYNTAVNTFRVKYNALPGDLTQTVATTFGFSSRNSTATAGQGDGNGLLDGEAGAASLLQGSGETGLFWVDLTTGGNLVDGSYSAAVYNSTVSPAATGLNSYIPSAKLGKGNYIYVYETNSTNYYGIEAVSGIAAGVLSGSGNIPVIEAYNIDKKVDDGQPATGNVIAWFVSNSAVNAAVHTGSPAATNCYDTGSTPAVYDITTNNGFGGNCALSFAFQ